MKIAQPRLAAAAFAAAIAAVTACASAQEQPKVNWKLQSAFGSQLTHLGTSARALRQGRRGHDRRQLRHQVSRARRAGAGAGMLRRRLQGLGGRLLVAGGQLCRQVRGAVVLHRGAVRSGLRRIHGLEDLRQRQQAARRDLRQARPDRVRRARHRPGDLGLVPPGDQVDRPDEGAQDALLRPGREGDAEARGLDPDAGGLGHLSGARARRDRRHRVLHARHGHQAGLPPGGEVQLLPGLAPARCR